MSPTTAGTSGAARPVRRLCLLGGESAGKTTLAQALAERLGMPWVPEYGRELWLRVGGTFGPELLEDHQVGVDGPGPDLVTAEPRDDRLPGAHDQGAAEQDRDPALAGELL